MAGPRIDSLRVKLGQDHPDDQRPHGWLRWAGDVARPLALGDRGVRRADRVGDPLLDLELGQNDVGALPTSTTARQSYDALTEGFGSGLNGPLLVAAKFQTGKEAEESLPALQKAVVRRGAAARGTPD